MTFSLPPSLWAVASISEEPETTLIDWQVFELPDGDRHLVGYAKEAREGRVSSAVKTFDCESMCAVTGSGRVYQLKGRPGVNSDAQAVWRAWVRINETPQFIDVSPAVWTASVSAKTENEGRPRYAKGGSVRGVD